jgi:hypothetical protein
MKNPQGTLPKDLADHKAVRKLLAMAESGSLSFNDDEMPSPPNAVGGLLPPSEGGNPAGYFWPPGYDISQTYAGLRRASWLPND